MENDMIRGSIKKGKVLKVIGKIILREGDPQTWYSVVVNPGDIELQKNVETKLPAILYISGRDEYVRCINN